MNDCGGFFTYMGDGSSSAEVHSKSSIVQSLIKEWSLFWASITEDFDNDKDLELPEGKLQALSLQQIREMMKALSQDRKALNQELEHIKEQLDEASSKLETVKLINGDVESNMNHIDQLHDIGQRLSEALQKIDERIREARSREQDLLEDEKIVD